MNICENNNGKYSVVKYYIKDKIAKLFPANYVTIMAADTLSPLS